MARVNPPPHIRLPKEILTNEPLARTLEQFNFNLFQLWQRTGGASDDISDVNGLLEFDDLLQKNTIKQTEVIVTSTDYTTYTDSIIICTDSVTIILNDTPNDGERVKVKITNGNVTISSTKLIDGQPEITINFADVVGQPLIECYYSIVTDTWYMI
jgi:hypothetical protein